jgi:hypothetical protein
MTIARTAAALLATLAVAAAATPAAAAPVPAQRQVSALREDDVRWTVQPSGPKGPAPGHNHFVYDLSPGEQIVDYVGISNLGAEPVTFTVYATDAFTAPDGGFGLLPAAQPPRGVGTWISLAKREYAVPAGKRMDIPFKVTVPAGAAPGDHAGGVIASVAVEETTSDGQRITVDRRVAARMYLRVHGPVNPAVEVTALDIKYGNPFVPFGGGDVTVTYRVANTGNVRVTGKARVQVKGVLGVRAGHSDVIDIPELLPDSEIRRTVTIPRVFPAGRLTAALAVNPETVDKEALPSATRAASVWAVPWLLVIVLGAAVAVPVVRLVLRRRRRGRVAPAVASVGVA